MGLVRNEIDGGMTKSIFKPSNEEEARAYQSLVDMVIPECPRCYTAMKLEPDDMLFEVKNPLTQTMYMDLATFTPVCPKCREKQILNDEIDLDQAFPTAVNTLKRAREKYEALRNSKKGGPNGKR